MLTVRLLGAPQITINGTRFQPGRKKAIALLATLILADGAVQRSTIAARLWPHVPEQKALANLRRDLAVLNRALTNRRITTESTTIAFHLDDGVDCDVRRFLAGAAGCVRHRPLPDPQCDRCRAGLQEAIDCYQAPFMAGFAVRNVPDFDAWQAKWRTRLATAARMTLASLADHAADSQDWPSALKFCRRRIDLETSDEAAHRQLLRIYAQSGDYDAARRHFVFLEEMLTQEEQRKPATATQSLVALIHAAEDAATTPETGDDASGDAGGNAGPVAPISPLVGRRRELDSLHTLLEQNERLITITGPGGIGKTKLALALAEDERRRFRRLVHVVPLEAVAHAGQLLHAILNAVHTVRTATTDPMAQLVNTFNQQPTLLVLDNCEHLVDTAAQGAAGTDTAAPDAGVDAGAVVVDLLRRSPTLQIVATSRTHFNLMSERLFPLQGLPVEAAPDAPRSDAVDLFALHMTRLRSKATLSEDDQAAVGDICRMLEGVPLAIILAASWCSSMTVYEIRTAVAGAGPFTMLESSAPDLPARHRRMRDVLSATWTQFDHAEQTVLVRCAIFRGGFDMPAAAAIAGASPGLLQSLVGTSVLQYREAQKRGRFQMHALIRRFADEQHRYDGERSEGRHHHAEYYHSLLLSWRDKLYGGGQIAAIQAIELDHANIRAAWAWFTDKEMFDRVLDMLEPLCHFYEWQGHAEDGVSLCAGLRAGLLQRADQIDAERLAHLFVWEGVFQFMAGERDQATICWQEADTLLQRCADAGVDVRPIQAQLALHRGRAQMYVDNTASARRYHAGALAYLYDSNQPWWKARALEELGWIDFNECRYAEGRRRFEASLDVRQSLNDAHGSARVLQGIGLCNFHLAHHQASDDAHRQAINLWQAAGNNPEMAGTLASYAWVKTVQGDLATACDLARRALAMADKAGVPLWRAHFRCTFAAEPLIHSGKMERTREQLQTGLALARPLGLRWSICGALVRLAKLALYEDRPVEALVYLEEGIRVAEEADRRDELAEGYGALALAQLKTGQRRAARKNAERALKTALAIQSFPAQITAAMVAARVLENHGRRAHALYAACRPEPFVQRSRWFSRLFPVGETEPSSKSTPTEEQSQPLPSVIAAILADYP